MESINRYIDHTLLKAEATSQQIHDLCHEALEYDFYSVCVNGSYVSTAKSFLKGSKVKIACVVGFPLGSMATNVKAYEADTAFNDGADEVDMVINVGALKDKKYDYVLSDIKALCSIAHRHSGIVKVIIETCLLTKDEIVKASQLALEGGADYVKTSTGFSTGGATAEDVALMASAIEGKAKIKASGGIRTYGDAIKMLKAGAQRLGVSASVKIMKESKK